MSKLALAVYFSLRCAVTVFHLGKTNLEQFLNKYDFNFEDLITNTERSKIYQYELS